MKRVELHLAGWGKVLRYAAVFGSAATGRMTADSDIDIFLVRVSAAGLGPDSNQDPWEQQVSELARLITAWTGNDARVIEYTEEELRDAAAAGEPLLDDVSKQGLTVAGTRAWFSTQLRSIGKAAPMRSL